MKLSLNKIYLGGISLLFILSIIFTSLAIYEEYKDFEHEATNIKKELIKKTKLKLKGEATKIYKIFQQYPYEYKNILQTFYGDLVYIEIRKNNKILFKLSNPPKKYIKYSLKKDTIEIVLLDSYNKIKKVIKQKKELLIHKLIKNILNFLTLSFIIYIFALSGFYLINEFLKDELNKFVKFFKKAYRKHIYMKYSDIKVKEFLNIAFYINKMLKEINAQNKQLKNINLNLEKKVNQKTIRLKKLVKLQENFIQTAIHEINTPLAIILSSLNFLDKNNKNVKRIESAVLMINNIYSDLSFILKYKHKNYPIQLIEIKDILQERIQFFEVIASIKKLKIKTEIENFIVKINKEELIRIIDNNLSNAIKYSIPNSTIIIKAKNHILSFKNTTSEVNNINKFFEPFYQENSNSQGFGLGLYLVSEICKKYNIKVKIENINNDIIFKYHFKDKDENSFN
ncbi:HAMP domain-containing histidine kinase [Caminibacter mediatlanticus TB-2]|uniref:histidine kinase n=1 Tax=Caminibacter mediatlanticus TB-2 TaxID=391592 RepID=A0ABX5V8Q9_9BACT|nr:HAMP domain-containing sensor histidine kinase [Caminibacter mediatlanticus]QCT94670.1 HAMP domain-containing histidine kinase [Caminibacter mediatlanticus TB-2]